MADEITAQNGQQAEEGEESAEQRIPYSRFEEVNKRLKQAERERDEAREQWQEEQDQKKTEAERAQVRAQRAEAERDRLRNENTALQKGTWVRSAATELGFHDPEDAIAHLGLKLAGFEDERDAKRAVKSLAHSKKHLVRSDDAKKDDWPRLGRIFGAEERQQRPLSPQQERAQREVEAAQGLAEELARHTSKWRDMGGIT